MKLNKNGTIEKEANFVRWYIEEYVRKLYITLATFTRRIEKRDSSSTRFSNTTSHAKFRKVFASNKY